MTEEIQFTKYSNRGADYHYRQINKFNLRLLNSYTLARYEKQTEIVYARLKDQIKGNSASLNVLDMGCGDGVLLYMLKKRYPANALNVFGVDLSEQALKTAKTKIPEGIFTCASVYDTPFEAGFFDLVISSDLIEHLQEPGRLLKEIKRVAKENALIVVGTPVRFTEKPLDPMHAREFFQQEYIELFSRYFDNCILEESHKQFHTLKYTKKIPLLKMGFNRYIYNLMTVLGRNRFHEKIRTQTDFPTYMYAVCRN